MTKIKILDPRASKGPGSQNMPIISEFYPKGKCQSNYDITDHSLCEQSNLYVYSRAKRKGFLGLGKKYDLYLLASDGYRDVAKMPLDIIGSEITLKSIEYLDAHKTTKDREKIRSRFLDIINNISIKYSNPIAYIPDDF
jgi:hypothetical protein